MSIKVLIVDDSAVVRQVLSQVFTAANGIEVMDVANDPYMAMDKMKAHWPDVIVLDVEMPRMDGITFLKQLMASRPTPVVICSSLTQKGTDISMQAMAAGAVEVIAKPVSGVKGFLEESSHELVMAVRCAAAARMNRVRVMPSANGGNPLETRPKLSADAILSAPTGSNVFATTERIIAIGTSTGGTQALEAVLTQLPRTCPGLAIVQHMPEKFTRSFADRLNSLSQIEVKEADNGDRILPGRALIAPGGKHMMVKRSGAYYQVEVVDGPLVSRHKPSVDVLFRSAAKFAGKNALGIIMTGMGDDGAKGLKEMHDCGAKTIAQDEESCVVFGMPKEAIKLGAADEVMSLELIAKAICR
ncbi:protein-glutamate methylesterase/protein-glutamine glutaminase [Chromobacterium vaccinii]|uniref:Protein-glutamate methylesterase/protein-glutamine glutaminase n=1 Tax=Chromobacterium vaccinii TaxID=1108595 RepID=A0A1D9LK86_9NEIS|nr:chemotaxis response regulator protein-glutamate methylesterase [Chromobacterium vaccinii]AOZ51722.1 chemotaxis response regulator protein-glutamate methylesterase [Chromobacterium vaccinii]QND86821.1 Chemotaxis response regulator protein-glutamate methylesterase CheB [Chromobacterium vaccinii]QND92052.1 Chemotaxis response regulator protein-glutamate methylesterase CheB [Chromobacterium vaccinii]SUX30381.1 Chemotaxis response regulator protein-glutamate methylesterase [Chromobacterium vaccin